MGFFYVDPEIYHKYRDRVLEDSQSIQVNYPEHLPPEKRRPGLSDAQIAEKLGLEERVVREIRCVAEREYYPIDEWERAIEFKKNSCSAYAKSGLSSVTRKYFDEAKKKK
jgi:ribosome-binding protein aMBF1 (putative translation factor)